MFKRDKRKNEEHEDELEGDEAAEPGAASSQEEPGSLTLMGVMGVGSGEADLDMQSLGEGSRLFNRGTMLVLGVVIIAAGALYGMRMSQADAGASADIKNAEAKIDKLAKKISVDGVLGETEVILAVLNDDRTRRQVPIEYTKQNPFLLLLEQQAKAEGPAKPGKPVEDPEVLRRAQVKAKLDAEFRNFKLQSVVPTGRTPVAIINNKILQIGHAIGSFKIKDIRNTTVVLEAEGEQYSLSLETDPNKPGR